MGDSAWGNAETTVAREMRAPGAVRSAHDELDVELSLLDDQLSELTRFLGPFLTDPAGAVEAKLSALDAQASRLTGDVDTPPPDVSSEVARALKKSVNHVRALRRHTERLLGNLDL